MIGTFTHTEGPVMGAHFSVVLLSLCVLTHIYVHITHICTDLSVSASASASVSGSIAISFSIPFSLSKTSVQGRRVWG